MDAVLGTSRRFGRHLAPRQGQPTPCLFISAGGGKFQIVFKREACARERQVSETKEIHFSEVTTDLMS